MDANKAMALVERIKDTSAGDLRLAAALIDVGAYDVAYPIAKAVADELALAMLFTPRTDTKRIDRKV